MPELVYTVKFVLDPSSEKIVGKAIDQSLEKKVNDAASAIENATGKQTNLNKVIEDGNQEIKERNKLLDANLDNLNNVDAKSRNYDNTLKRLITDEKSSIQSIKRKAQEHSKFIPVLQSTIAEMRQYGSSIQMNDKESARYNRSLAKSEQTLRTMMSTHTNLNNSLQQSIGEMGDLTSQAGRFNKTMSGANQTIFAFGDLVQDSTQFMIGGKFNFASGMRAIGNNVGFAAELFGNLRQNVVRYNQAVADGTIKNAQQVTTLQALIRSFKGVGGVVAGINIVMTGLTIATQLFNRQQKEAVKNVDDFARGISLADDKITEYTGRFEDAFGTQKAQRLLEFAKQDVDNLEGALSNVNSQIGQLQRALRTYQGSTTSDEERERILESLGLPSSSEFNVRIRALLDAREEIENVLSARKESVDQLREEAEATKTAYDEYRRYVELQLTEEMRSATIEDARRNATNDFYEMYAGIQAFNGELHKTPPTIDEMLASVQKVTLVPDEFAGSIKMLEGYLSEVMDNFANASFKFERDILRDRIEGINARLSYMKNGLADVLSLEDLGVEDFEIGGIMFEDSIAGQKEYLEYLRTQYENTMIDSERVLLAKRIEYADNYINYLQDGLAPVLNLEDLIGDFDADNIPILDESGLLRDQAKEQQTALTQAMKDGIEDRAREFENQKDLYIKDQKAFELAEKGKQMARELAIQGAQAASALFQELFGESKAIAIAETLVSTYFSAQKAYASQLTVPTPEAPIRARVAAGIAIAQGLARVAAIKNTNIGTSSASNNNGNGSSGFNRGASGIISHGQGIATQSNRNVGFIPSRGGEFSGTEITVINTFDDETVADVVDRGNRKRQMQQVSVS